MNTVYTSTLDFRRLWLYLDLVNNLCISDKLAMGLSCPELLLKLPGDTILLRGNLIAIVEQVI